MERVEWHMSGDQCIPVIFVDPGNDVLKRGTRPPYLGVALSDTRFAYVREDLPQPLKAFIVEHELYHLRDKWTWWGRLGEEIRANFAAARRKPLGFIAYVRYCLVHCIRVTLGHLKA